MPNERYEASNPIAPELKELAKKGFAFRPPRSVFGGRLCKDSYLCREERFQAGVIIRGLIRRCYEPLRPRKRGFTSWHFQVSPVLMDRMLPVR